MALVVEDGTGKSDAESYISTADVTTYLTARRVATDFATWTAADATTKEIAVRLATQWLDARYHERWRGVKFSGTQALNWPRDSVELDSYILSASDIPQQLLDATAELALKETDGDTLFADMADEGTVSSKAVRIGLISESIDYSGGSRGIKRYRLVEALVSVLIEPSNQLQRA